MRAANAGRSETYPCQVEEYLSKATAHSLMSPPPMRPCHEREREINPLSIHLDAYTRSTHLRDCNLRFAEMCLILYVASYLVLQKPRSSTLSLVAGQVRFDGSALEEAAHLSAALKLEGADP